jgi:hypothetical protein
VLIDYRTQVYRNSKFSSVDLAKLENKGLRKKDRNDIKCVALSVVYVLPQNKHVVTPLEKRTVCMAEINRDE